MSWASIFHRRRYGGRCGKGDTCVRSMSYEYIGHGVGSSGFGGGLVSFSSEVTNSSLAEPRFSMGSSFIRA